MTPLDRVESLRAQMATTIQRGTDLIADLQAVTEGVALLMPSLRELTEAERTTDVARLCGFDADLPERLRVMVESLADALAALTVSDGGEAWLRHQLARLRTDEDEPTA